MQIIDDNIMGKLSHPAIILVGRTGSGKSSFGNRLYSYLTGDPKPVFQVGDSMFSETQISKSQVITIGNKNYDLVDTPGLFDTSGTDQEVIDEVKRTVEQCMHGIQAVIFITEYGRITKEVRDVMNMIIQFFGVDVKSNMILVVNKVDGEKALKRELLEEQLMKDPPSGQDIINPVKELIFSLNRRWILSTNVNAFPDPNDANWLREVNLLTGQITSLQAPYTTDVFRRICEERIRQEEERCRLEEAKRLEEERRKEEQERLRKEAEEAERLRIFVEQQKIEMQRIEREHAERLRQEQERQAYQAEIERKAREEAERIWQEQQREAERIRRENEENQRRIQEMIRQQQQRRRDRDDCIIC